jgi:ActR/RegA family two-component response regulator
MNASGDLLLVDDDRLHARSLARAPSLLGWQVRVAGSGEEAIPFAAVRAENRPPVVADRYAREMVGAS